MSAELFVHPEISPIGCEEFKAKYPLGSIALDGYVQGEPMYDPIGYLNANHHEGVDRFATRSTAQQIHMRARVGLCKDEAFKKDGLFAPSVYANDCDQDVCTAWYLLNHIDQANLCSNPILDRLVTVAGRLDSTAGAYPYDVNQKILGELAWVFEPYTMFRASGEMAKKDGAQYKSVIQNVEMRIQKHLMGRGDSAKLDFRYNIIGGGNGWKMIEEVGREGRIGALSDGIDAYVMAQQEADDRWRYSIGRRSEHIPFDVLGLMDVLNTVEGCTDDRWGGATTIGGSPRVGGSKLPPDEVEGIINQHICS